MFVRKKPNKSGSTSVQVIDKSSGSYHVVKTLGSSQDSEQVDQLVRRAHQWISHHAGQSELDFHDEKQLYSSFISAIQQVTVAGTELLLGKLFEQIGFGQIKDELFRYLVLSRLCYPVSKLKTTDYLQKYHGIAIDEDAYTATWISSTPLKKKPSSRSATGIHGRFWVRTYSWYFTT